MSDEITTLFVPVKYSWDYVPSIYDTYRGDSKADHNHIPRVEEMPLLIDFIERREVGALLITGKRGVGKTSAIILALNTVMERVFDEGRRSTSNRSNFILPVFVNAPSFDIHRKIKETGEIDDQIDLIEVGG